MNRSRSGYVYIVLCAVIFSTMEVMLKTVHGVFAPMQITVSYTHLTLPTTERV